MKKVVGTVIFLVFAAAVWTAGPLIEIGLNVLLRPDYHMRDLRSEYQARLVPNRARWFEYKAYRMDCSNSGQRRAVLLHTTEFSETPLDFLSRTFPQCSNVRQVKDEVPGLFHGIGVGRI